MKSENLWVLVKDKSEMQKLEIFCGRMKVNKNGIFSGPLRKQRLNFLTEDKDLQFLFNLRGAIQTDKMTFVISDDALKILLKYMSENKMNNVFCKLTDKKLHHVENYVVDEKSEQIYFYDVKTQSLHFNSSAIEEIEETEKNLTNFDSGKNPGVSIYFNIDSKNIVGIIVFEYAEGALRNYAYEQEVKFNLEKIGGVTGRNNKIIFAKKNFFTRTIRNFQNFNFKLFWGKDNKRISNYTVKSSISYGMDWFNLSGTIQSDFGEYKLSDIVKLSRGKNYVELDDKIYFLPDALKNLSAVSEVADDKITLPKTSLRQINDFAFEYDIPTESYLKNFLNFTNYDLKLRDIFVGKLKNYQQFGAAWIFNLYKNYRPLKFFGVLSVILMLIALYMFFPIFMEFLDTSKVPRFPTLIVSSILGLSSLMSLVCGLILDTIADNSRKNFELKMNIIKMMLDKKHE